LEQRERMGFETTPKINSGPFNNLYIYQQGFNSFQKGRPKNIKKKGGKKFNTRGGFQNRVGKKQGGNSPGLGKEGTFL